MLDAAAINLGTKSIFLATSLNKLIVLSWLKLVIKNAAAVYMDNAHFQAQKNMMLKLHVIFTLVIYRQIFMSLSVIDIHHGIITC